MISPTKIYRLSPHRVSMPSMVRIPAFVKTRQVNIHSPIKKQSRDRILSHNVGQSHYQEIIQFQQEQMLTTEQKISLLQSEVQLWKSRYQDINAKYHALQEKYFNLEADIGQNK